MGILKNLFKSDKKYYLELDEVKDSKVVQDVAKAATEVSDTVKEKAASVANSQPVKEAVKTATEVTDTAQEQLASVVTEDKPEQAKPVAAKASSKSKAKSKKKGKTGKSTTKTESAKVTAKNSGASSYDPPFWVAAMYNNNSNGSASSNGAATESETFATSNLMPTVTNYRRRPGGSLNKFKDMAKNVRTGRR